MKGRISYYIVYALMWAYQKITGKQLWNDE